MLCTAFTVCLSFLIMTVAEDKVTKACYGTPGLPCTGHDLRCEQGVIAITDAYYTKDNNICTQGGRSNCAAFDNISNGNDRYSFNSTEFVDLFGNCSYDENCVYRAPRRKIDSATRTFTAVKYTCIQATIPICGSVQSHTNTSKRFVVWTSNATLSSLPSCSCTINSTQDIQVTVTALDVRLSESGKCTITSGNGGHFNCSSSFSPFKLIANTTVEVGSSITLDIQRGDTNVFEIVWLKIEGNHKFNLHCSPNGPRQPGSNISEPNSSSDNKGAIIGAVVVVLVVIGAVVLIVFLIKRRRALKDDRTTNDAKDAGANYSKPGLVHENYQYDYITDADVRAGNKVQVNHDITKHQSVNQINKPLKGQHGFEDADYDRINRKHSNVDNDKYEADYDTTAATNAGLATEDDYGYNHVDRQKVSNANQNDYDTTASASKAVVDMATTEDDYDHFKRERAANVVGSPYDTAGIVGSSQDGFSQVGENDHQLDAAVNTVGSLCDVAGTVRQPRDDYCLAGRAEGGDYDLAK